MSKATAFAGPILSCATDGVKYETQAPDEERKAARDSLKTWLKDQFALIKAGKKSQIKEQRARSDQHRRLAH